MRMIKKLWRLSCTLASSWSWMRRKLRSALFSKESQAYRRPGTCLSPNTPQHYSTAPQLFINNAELIPQSVSCGLAGRSSEKQKHQDSAKSDHSEGQEQDEYGGSTDEEPGDVQETAAPTSLPPGQNSLLEQLLESVLSNWPSQALGNHLESSNRAYVPSLNNYSCGIIKTRKNMSLLHCCRSSWACLHQFMPRIQPWHHRSYVIPRWAPTNRHSGHLSLLTSMLHFIRLWTCAPKGPSVINAPPVQEWMCILYTPDRT